VAWRIVGLPRTKPCLRCATSRHGYNMSTSNNLSLSVVANYLRALCTALQKVSALQTRSTVISEIRSHGGECFDCVHLSLVGVWSWVVTTVLEEQCESVWSSVWSETFQGNDENQLQAHTSQPWRLQSSAVFCFISKVLTSVSYTLRGRDKIPDVMKFIATSRTCYIL
jgi:hypothetical protein